MNEKISGQVIEPVSARTRESTSARMKTFVEWSDALSIGVETIDEQHKSLVAMLNEMYEGINGGWGRKARDEVLDKLVSYTVVHFETEESLMEASNYPEEKEHKQRHAKLIQMVGEYIEKYNEDPNASNYDLLFFLKRWLVDHIQRDDKLLGQHLLKKGVANSLGENIRALLSRIKNWFSASH